MTNFLLTISLETWSHIAGVLGLFAIVASGLLAWRKELLKLGFDKFQDLYRLEMTTFKSEVRGYMNKADERHTKILDRIAELYEKTHNEILAQNMICKVVQGRKPAEVKLEKEWKSRIETELNGLEKKISHIEVLVDKNIKK